MAGLFRSKKAPFLFGTYPLKTISSLELCSSNAQAMKGETIAAMKYKEVDFMAGEEGFEPSHQEPESCVLPLDDSPFH